MTLLRRRRTALTRSSGEREAQAARRLERIVRSGQAHTWDRQEVLGALVERHGRPRLDGARLAAVGRLLSVIYWGELAAWKVSSELAETLETPQARAAALAQSDDEARHFSSLHDYLGLVGWPATRLPRATRRVLDAVLQADSLAKKLVGMQLLVEPVALTFFQLLQDRQIEPVLSGLLAYVERDEARHIALGINHLPVVVDSLTSVQRAELWAWQLRMFVREMDGLKELEGDLRTLGFDPRDAIRLGRSKQLYVVDVVSRKLRFELPLVDLFNRAVEFRQELDYGSHAPGGLLRAMRCAMNPEEVALAV